VEFNSNLFYSLDGQYSVKHSVSVMKFPGGEVGVDINTGSLQYDDPETQDIKVVTIESRVRNSDDLMALFLATDALRRVYVDAVIDLFIPYFPYARQDRVCNNGEALSVSVAAQLINSQNYNSVIVVDPHSPVTSALIHRCIIWDQVDVFKRIKDCWSEWTIVAPDQGALKKTEDFAKRVGAAGVVSCSKNRELATGKITGMYINGPGDMSHMNLLVLDDICDGGRTFIELAALIQRVGPSYQPLKMELAVTHGIFSKGVGVVADHYDMIHTSDSFTQQEHASLNVIKF
jgi:ribose-phosphate pyrophosphokinase